MVRTCIEYNREDTAFLEKFQEELLTLTGLIEETFVQNPVILLQPVYRKMLIDKARAVEAMHAAIRKHKLFIDNPCDPLEMDT